MELLIPAGNLSKLKTAVDYGADAVYFSGVNFGLRAASDNFSNEELKEGVNYCHLNNVKAYITINGFLHDEDINQLEEYVNYLDQIKVDAFIVSDLGVLSFIKTISETALHLSTQASCVNSLSGKFWKQMGAKRLILGREASLEEGLKIKKFNNIEVEMFIHGSMCMSYSGNCTISNFTQGRDSNRGGCAQSCRFDYSFYGPSNNEKKENIKLGQFFFMSSKDLNGIELIPYYFENKIDSIKVEGRMKSNLYVSSVTKTYKEALIDYQTDKKLYYEKINYYLDQLNKFSHRDYTKASLISKADETSIHNDRLNGEDDKHQYIGKVIHVNDDKTYLVEVKKAFSSSTKLELVTLTGENIKFSPEKIFDLENEIIERTRPSTVVLLSSLNGVKKNQLIKEAGEL